MPKLTIDTRINRTQQLFVPFQTLDYLQSEYNSWAKESGESVKIQLRVYLQMTKDHFFYQATSTYLGAEAYCSDWIHGTSDNIFKDKPSRTYGYYPQGSYAFGGSEVGFFSCEVEKTHEEQIWTARARCKAEIGGNGYHYDTGSSSKYIDIEILVAPKESFTVSFDANGGTQEQCPDALTKWYGEELSIPECVMASDLGRFVGWSLSPTGAVAFSDGIVPAGFNEAATLYAVWDSGSYELVLEPGFEGEESVSYVHKVGFSYVLEPSPFERQGFDFLGWSTNDGGTIDYRDRDVIDLETSSYRPIVTLYACWYRGEPTISSLETDRKDEDTGVVRMSYATYETDGYVPIVTAHLILTSRSDGSVLTIDIEGIENEVAFDLPGIGESSYDLAVYIDDGIKTSDIVYRSLAISTGTYTLDFARGGKGIGVLMRCPEGADSSPKGFHVNAEDGMFVNEIDYSMTREQLEELYDLLGIDAGVD